MQSQRSYSPVETLRSPLFWLLYFMMALVSAGGLRRLSSRPSRMNSTSPACR
jgi:hypothetical protein